MEPREESPLEPLFELLVTLSPPVTAGRGVIGERRMVPITGGTLSGRLDGTVLPGGADWQVIRPDGLADIDARYHLRTREGAIIEVRSRGVRYAPPEILTRLLAGEMVDPDLYYFRTSMRFETAAPELQWLTRSLAVARGERRPDQVFLRVFRVA